MQGASFRRGRCAGRAWVWLAGAVWMTAGPAAGGQVEHVFIVSMDGARPDVVRRASMPHLEALRRAGSWTWNARTVFPSVTLPAHASMVGGCGPEQHGVDWNEYWPQRGYTRATTVFELARRRGLRTAMVVCKQKLRQIAHPRDVGLFFQAPRDADTAVPVARKAAEVIRRQRPHLMLIHFRDADSAGHRYRWGSPRQVEALENCDRALGILLAALEETGLRDRSLLLITSDHGGHGKIHGSPSAEDMTIPWICAGGPAQPNYRIPVPVSVCDTAATAARALSLPIPADWEGRPVPGVLTSPHWTSLPAPIPPPARASAPILVAEPGESR